MAESPDGPTEISDGWRFGVRADQEGRVLRSDIARGRGDVRGLFRMTARRTRSEGEEVEAIMIHDRESDDGCMEPSFVRQFELGEICVIKVGRRWIVRVGGEDIQVPGGKTDAVDRAFSIAQLGDGPVDVVIFGKGDVIEQRRSFRSRAQA